MDVLWLKVDEGPADQHDEGENACGGDEGDGGRVLVSDEPAEYGDCDCVDYQRDFHLAFRKQAY